MLTQFWCFFSLFAIWAAELFLFQLLDCILYSEMTQIMTTKMTRFFQMQATWWNRLEVDKSDLVEQAWCKCKQPGGTGLMLRCPRFVYLWISFYTGNSWIFYHCCAHADSILLLWLISLRNMSSWMVFISTFVLHTIFRSDPNYDNKNDKVFPNASNLMEQAWSWYKQPGGKGLM